MGETGPTNNTSFSSLDDNWETDVNVLSSELGDLDTEGNDKSDWMRLLGVSMKPNPLDDWDQLYNLNNQCALRNDCRKLANGLKNKRSVPELESFLTLYCKKRGMDYIKDIGWLTILEKILLLNVPAAHEFNVFFAFTTKYIPKDTRPDAQIFDLFRLLLQYHDPQISNHLESLHCSPSMYTKNWFATLFSSSMSTESCHELWKLYIEQGDPFLVFHLAIVFLINAKDEILQVKRDEKEKAVQILENMAAQLSVEDVPDFFQLALHYSDKTPECIRKDFHYIIFGANFDEEVKEIQMNKMLCLPIPAIDLTSHDEISSGSVNFFIVDTRSNTDFDSGHFVSSFNLDCVAIVDEPEKFEIALNSLECYKTSRRDEDHYLILGYGSDEEDNYMNMLIAMFIQKGKLHVSFVQGGYKKLHDCIGQHNRWELIAMHSEDRCELCSSEKASPKWGFFSKMKSAVSNTSSRMKERVEAVVFPIGEEKKLDDKHADSKQRHGKRYRQQSVFTIDENSDDEMAAGAAVDENPKEEILLSKEFTETFECQEVFRDGSINGHIALTRTHIYVLHDVPGKQGYVTTEARHALSTVVAVTSRRSVPEMLTFKLGYEMNGSSKITAVHKLYVPKAGECAKAVKLAIYALRPLPDA
ncbi:TBC1 domain family member 23 [Caenorhabditis elegans]|uniref:TBC1 domain family member 23 n=1 Tax=Caenorhabditis elegans TaxID=6239 RepID=Q93534_CAEEL|nr:TBC1 domain family member 23 [Caenorhabditis elegans]CAB01744.2 TBC1 domain family member 23 [Caenorhabditis elegans]|eukprot:NP_510485.2 TBC (Tre-2/Bub2/Cdc16) domain family [Caenorhabditis elegans]